MALLASAHVEGAGGHEQVGDDEESAQIDGGDLPAEKTEDEPREDHVRLGRRGEEQQGRPREVVQDERVVEEDEDDDRAELYRAQRANLTTLGWQSRRANRTMVRNLNPLLAVVLRSWGTRVRSRAAWMRS